MLGQIGFLHEQRLFVQFGPEFHGVRTIAADKNHFKPGPLGSQFLSQFPSAHTLWHDDVGYQEIYLGGVLAPNRQGIGAGGCFQDMVSMVLKDDSRQSANWRRIFDQQYGFRAANGFGFDAASFGGNAGDDAGQKNVKLGSNIELAGDFDPAPVLFDDAIDGGKPQAGALANGLGGEKGS